MQIDPSKINTSGTLDISLVNNKGQVSKLSDLKGRVVILDFHAFAANESTARIMKLREIYNKYHAQGLEIYQVSVDPNEHFWKQQTVSSAVGLRARPAGRRFRPDADFQHSGNPDLLHGGPQQRVA